MAALRTLATYSTGALPHHRRRHHVSTPTAWLVAVGNTRTYASGMMITPSASVHDGLLDVCVVGPVSRVDFLRTFPSVFRGAHVDHPQVRTWRGVDVSDRSTRRHRTGGAVGQWRARGAAAGARRTGGGRAGGDGARDRREHYLTVSVPSMPAARCPVTLQ